VVLNLYRSRPYLQGISDTPAWVVSKVNILVAWMFFAV
jgi:hypothetical protein